MVHVSILSNGIADALLQTLPARAPFVSDPRVSGAITFTLRRCTVSGTPTRGAVLRAQVNGSRFGPHRYASLQVRLRAGWARPQLSRGVARLLLEAGARYDQYARAARAEAAFKPFEGNDTMIGAAETYAREIGWDGVYDFVTQEQLERFEFWCQSRLAEVSV